MGTWKEKQERQASVAGLLSAGARVQGHPFLFDTGVGTVLVGGGGVSTTQRNATKTLCYGNRNGRSVGTMAFTCPTRQGGCRLTFGGQGNSYERHGGRNTKTQKHKMHYPRWQSQPHLIWICLLTCTLTAHCVTVKWVEAWWKAETQRQNLDPES